MTLNRFAVSALALVLSAGTGAAVAQYSAPGTGAYGYAPVHTSMQDRDDHDRRDEPMTWDAAPRGYNDIQLRGYRDGIDGAQKDYGNHRRPNPNNRENYKHPHDVPHDLDRDYRAAFRQGYRRAFRHLEGHDNDPN